MSVSVRSVAVLLPACLAMAAGPLRAQPQIEVAAAERPPVLDRIGELPEMTLAVAISPDGQLAAVAVPSDRLEQSIVWVYGAGGDEPVRIALSGLLRDLLFSRDGSMIYGLAHKPAKKREGDTYLITVDYAAAKSKRVMRTPASARDLDHWITADALLIATRNEIRTVLLPDLRSGPLYRVVGENLSVVSLAGGDLVLIGQETELLLVNLRDPPGRRSMPIRDSAAPPGPVVSLADFADGSGALARLDDGRLFDVSFNPLSIAARGTTTAVASVGKQTAALASMQGVDPLPRQEAQPPPATAAAVAASPDETEPAAQGPAAEPSEPEPSAVDTTAPDSGTRPTAAAATVAVVAESQPADPPATEEAPDTAAEEAAEAAPQQPPAARENEPVHQVQGRVTGAAASLVREVVLMGPDNIMREARRVVPGADGAWAVDGLAPGRYKVQLYGGGSTVLISEPSFLILDVPARGSVQAAPFDVLRSL